MPKRAKYVLGRNFNYNNCGSESYNNGKIWWQNNINKIM